MPRFGGRYPKKLHLEHDVGAYFKALGIGSRRYLDPERPRQKLASFPRATLSIEDPEATCWAIPETRMTYDAHHVPFELSSPLRLEDARARFLKKRDVIKLKVSSRYRALRAALPLG
jgi:hypothetical protein